MPTLNKISFGAAAAAAAAAVLVSSSAAFPLYSVHGDSLWMARADNTSLESCLSSSGGFEQAYASSGDYTALTSSYNPLFSYKPLVVAVPNTESEVASIVKCVAAHEGRQKLSPKSGGHSYEAYSLGGQDGSVVIDLSRLDSIQVDQANKTAAVGAGVRLGTLAQGIWDQGKFALPHGTCPLVGVSGHALGGGFGYTTRAWGFLLDRIQSMRVVTSKADVITVSAEENTDLWWGLRGGGANNFGVVTQFTFALQDAPTQTLNYNYAYATNEDCAKAIVAIQDMSNDPDTSTGLQAELGGELLVAGSAAGDFDGNACQLAGQHINTAREAHDALMARLHTRAGVQPATTSVKPFDSWIDALTDLMGNLSATGPQHEQFYAKSLVQPTPARYNYTSALALVSELNSYAGLRGTGNSISFDFLGALAYSAKMESASFNAHGATLINQFYSYGFPSNDDPDAQQDVWKAFDSLVQTAKASAPDADWGAYVNYVDARLDDWAHAYYGAALDRLKQLKSTWDPQSVFDFPQGLAHA